MFQAGVRDTSTAVNADIKWKFGAKEWYYTFDQLTVPTVIAEDPDAVAIGAMKLFLSASILIISSIY
jgi:hypothetical protein